MTTAFDLMEASEKFYQSFLREQAIARWEEWNEIFWDEYFTNPEFVDALLEGDYQNV